MSVVDLHEAVERSAAPAAVSVALDRLEDQHPGLRQRLAEDHALRETLLAVLAASRSLTELCVTDPGAIDVLSALDARPPLSADNADELRRWKRLELLRIAARDLTGIDELPAVGRALADLAGDVLAAACRLAEADGLAVIGMGKLGASELNYASDIDVLFVGAAAGAEDEAAARRVVEMARMCYRVDVDLRPEGRDGPLVRSLDSYRAYWERWASTWEFQALLKARAVAGDAGLGTAFVSAAQDQIWRREFGPDELRAVRSLKARAESDLARRGLSDREVKRGPGGIRDIEFAVQLLQLVHGRQDPGLRIATTLDALAELANAGYIDPQDGRDLAAAYGFLRTVEHRLQLVDELQVHAIPTDPAARERLARVMGYRDRPAASALERFAEDLRRHQGTVRSIHERLFFRPLLDALVGQPPGPALTGPAIETRLAAFGFTDAERTRQALRELTRGLTRSSRLMKQMLPLLLSWLSESPDPDLGMLSLRRLTTGRQRTTELVTAFRESPEAARRLCLLLGTSRHLGDTLEHHPDLIPALADPEALAPRPAPIQLAAAKAALAWRDDLDTRQSGLQRFVRREELRIAARDVLELGVVDEDAVVATATDLTQLAEAAIEAALGSVAPELPFAVIAMGRFGGAELSYASDLDVMFVYDGGTAGDFTVAEEAATTLMHFLRGQTPTARIYDLDLNLRPEGKQGPLARSLEGYREYYDRWAQMWERQALVKARPIAGDPALGRRFMELIAPHVWRGLTESEAREVRRMKARIERERIPAGEDPQFHLKLGRGSLSDVEFTAQLLQLQHCVPATGTMAALHALRQKGVLTEDDYVDLSAAYRFCERTRNRLFLVRGQPLDSLPTQAVWLARLARSLDTTPGELREQYRRVTRRCRQVVQRVFYGAGDP